jgi:hypothetical protein
VVSHLFNHSQSISCIFSNIAFFYDFIKLQSSQF